MNQDNGQFGRDFRTAILSQFVSLVMLSLLSLGCTPADQVPAKKPSGDQGNVASASSNCETSGPLKLFSNAQGFYALQTLTPRLDLFCAIVVPIEGSSLELISNRSQVYDYRRGFPTDKISHVVFFNTTLREISAVAEVIHTLAGDAEEIVNLTWESSGRNIDEARSFFSGQPFGFAVRFKNVQTLEKPLSLNEARTLDAKFQRPFGYLFLERHPAVSAEIQHRLPSPDDIPPAI